MKNLNNHGQSLVMFILMIPILVGVMILVIDIGNTIVYKSHTDGVIEMVLDLALDKKIDENQVRDLLNENIGDNRNIITISDNKVDIESTGYVKGIFSNLFGFRGFYIKSSYVGVKENNKNVISKKK